MRRDEVASLFHSLPGGRSFCSWGSLYTTSKTKRNKRKKATHNFLFPLSEIVFLITLTTSFSFKEHFNSFKKPPFSCISFSILHYKYYQHHHYLNLQAQHIQRVLISFLDAMSASIIILLLCISSLHSCSGQNLRVEANDGPKKQLQYVNKENSPNAPIITDSPNVDPSLWNKLEESKRSSIVKQIRVHGGQIPKKINSEAIIEEIMKVERMLRSKDGDRHSHESLVSVSFPVPRYNEGLDHHPEFNLDYTPPKTHPPIHN